MVCFKTNSKVIDSFIKLILAIIKAKSVIKKTIIKFIGLRFIKKACYH